MASRMRLLTVREERSPDGIPICKTARRSLWYNTAQMDFDTIVKLAL